MDMNRLLGNVDGALDRALRSRKLEFQLMRAAADQTKRESATRIWRNKLV